MSYLQNALTKGETVAYQGKMSLWALLPSLLMGLIFLFAGLVFWPLSLLALMYWVGAAIYYVTTELAITNKRVIAKFGLISRATIEINLQNIESIQVRQSILGRIFDYGSIIVSGAGSPQAPVPGIRDPLRFRRAFLDAQEEKGERGDTH